MPPSVNIGLNIGTRQNAIQPSVALAALRVVGGANAIRFAVHDSASEPTLVAELDRPLNRTAAYELARTLKQDAVAYHDGRDGFLDGPAAHAWGDFDPAFYLTLDGTRLSQPLAA